MKSNHEFDVETAVAEWRQQMLAAGVQTPVPLGELEGHLREEIAQQTESSRSEAEAFAAAVQKIGPAHVIQGEFKKVDGAQDARRWKLLEITLGTFASVMPLWMWETVIHRGASSPASLTTSQQVSGVIAVGAFAALAWGGRLGCRLFPVVWSRRVRSVLAGCFVVPVALWWIAFMTIIVPRYDFTMGEFLVAFLWAFVVPGGAVIGLAWGLEAAAQKNTAAVS